MVHSKWPAIPFFFVFVSMHLCYIFYYSASTRTMEVVLYRGISCHIDLNSRDINVLQLPTIKQFQSPVKELF